MSAHSAIRPVGAADLDTFFDYLNEHLQDNGSAGAPLFQPMPRGQSRFAPDKEAAFRAALALPLGQPGWRRAWIATGANGIQGHVDLRARPDGAASHRALLGMGVHRAFRRLGLGHSLVEAALAWAGAQPGLDWVDLEVLSVNLAARRLYLRCGFVQSGEIADMFRVDGEQLAYCFMHFRLPR
ncbi:GNAT family N-acetyltransferase [Rugamonas sp. CCM 8940]|uniref:GNAT family N-acetyltransferase n=1 Tax=Rugamonas sp. CCM 8940 TaxID=2765359 RepID=UPI0018F6A95E|nr:GNAT family protein [Rugamonas sp. CCM 8940]MBJ7308649.1 GNAT family N-acetyltransferase [Rugamonas sp. CCM 8940]